MSTDARRFLSIALRRIILPIALLTAVMISLGLLITKSLVHTWPFTIEDQVNRTLFADRTPIWDIVTNAICVLANTPVIIAVTAFVAGVMWIAYKRWREPLFIVAVVPGVPAHHPRYRPAAPGRPPPGRLPPNVQLPVGSRCDFDCALRRHRARPHPVRAA
jgi:hypothetical protein